MASQRRRRIPVGAAEVVHGAEHGERREALAFLQSDNLLDLVLDDFEACGIVGERTAKLTGYLAATL